MLTKLSLKKTTARNLVRLFLAVAFASVVSLASACAAFTSKGTQCKRAPAEGSAYCWQHGGGKSVATKPSTETTSGVKTKATTTKSSAGTASGVKLPKSYEVYQQRKLQGARTFSKSMRERKYKEQGGKCPHCGKTCTFGEMEGDHIVPYSKGGKTEYPNLQMLCTPCNRSKGNRYSH